MPLGIDGDGIFYGKKRRTHIHYEEFPSLLLRHRKHCESTGNIEATGRSLYRSLVEGPSSDEQIERFVSDVCVWGGDDGTVLDQIAGGQSWEIVRSNFEQAAATLSMVSSIGNQDRRLQLLSKALHEVTATFGLGNSYGSKMLRMQRPDLCGVLDSRVRGQIDYVDSTDDFAGYSEQLVQVAQSLNQRAIVQPIIVIADWCAGDVDAVVYARLKDW